eukprot:TRINITY_DN34584_c0_g1_i1.p2 TRINITY_DN34584_c0_g1~~TRINITY_DN34584_c0_g1_i1.p2  ORF type:complete len:168 (+),score=38.44 TRINITY_DN34584_c0_g1_i1:152-655(+)
MYTTPANMNIVLPSPGANLTKVQLDIVAENFRLLDRDKDGKLSKEEVTTLFCALGQNPSDEELGEMLSMIPPTGLDADSFVAMFSTQYRAPLTEDTVLRAFTTFDSDRSGMMRAERLRELLTSTGAPLTDEEMEAIIKEAQPDEREVFDYRRLATHLCEVPRIGPGV